tara:strand:- start:1637 stop:2314 length:678 start_codon:yes stop_codon:yes gene_type:complete
MTHFLKQIKEQIDDADFAFENKSLLCNDVIRNVMELQKKHKTPIHLEFEYKKICFSNPTTNQTYNIINQDKKETDGMYIQSREVEMFQQAIKDFKKTGLKNGEEVIVYHNELRDYRFGTWNEIMNDIKNHNLKLVDCNVRTWKWGSKKYIRFTLVSNIENKSCGLSGMEFAFGHHIDGFSYCLESELWKEKKQELYAIVERETTEYGKDTRIDIGGNMYNKKIRR